MRIEITLTLKPGLALQPQHQTQVSCALGRLIEELKGRGVLITGSDSRFMADEAAKPIADKHICEGGWCWE